MRDDPLVIALVAKAANGDQAAWNDLVERYAPLVWSICGKYRLDRSDIDDVAQSVWLLLVEKIDSLREPAGNPGPSGISQGYSHGQVFANNSRPQIAPVNSGMQPVGSLANLPFGNYLVEASVDVENLNGGCCGNNSMDIECQISPASDTGHLFLNGHDTAEPWGTLTMVTALPSFGGTINYQCVATTGNGNASGVTVQSVRINAVALDNLSNQ